MENKKILSSENINNLLLAILICIPMGSFILEIDNIIPITNVLVLVIILLVNMKKIKEVKLDLFTILYICIFIILLLFNIIIFGIESYVIERIMYLIVFGVIPCISFRIVIIADKKINIEKLIKFIIYIFAIMGVFLINIDFWKYEPGRRMSISYYILPLFIAIVIQAMFYDKGKTIKYKIIKYLIYIVIFYVYINFYIVFASRGALISILVCLLICFIASKKDRDKKILYTILGGSIIIILLLYLGNILNAFNNILKSFNINSATIERTINLLEEENIGNGRDSLYKAAIDDIQENLLLGNGIGEFYNEYGTYPHNIVLQLLHEGGILYMIFAMAPIIYSVYLMIFSKEISNEKKYLLIFLFSVSMVRLMISYEYWKDNYFWIYLYMIFIPQTEKRSVEENGNSNNSDI